MSLVCLCGETVNGTMRRCPSCDRKVCICPDCGWLMDPNVCTNPVCVRTLFAGPTAVERRPPRPVVESESPLAAGGTKPRTGPKGGER